MSVAQYTINRAGRNDERRNNAECRSARRLGNAGLVEDCIQRSLGQCPVAVVRNDHIPISDRVEPASVATDAMTSNEAVSAKVRLDLSGVHRFHARAMAGRVRQMRRRLLVR